MSFARLQKRINELGNPTVVGLDPALEYIPPKMLSKYVAEHGETLEAASLAVLEFNLGLINGLCDIVPAVKPQSAYYEQLGAAGVSALVRTCEYAKSKGMYVILDGKRGDIGTTASAYSTAYLGAVQIKNTEHMPFNADALTVNAYLGSDGLKPFIKTAEKYDKAVFALVKTSNPSAGELQDRPVKMKTGDSPQIPQIPFYAAVGDLIESISLDTADEYGYTRVGAVVGATYPEEMKFLRERLKHTFFLVPGYGAQGGTAEDAVHAFDKDGRGAIVNSSRKIIAAWKENSTGAEDCTDAACYIDAAREEAIKMRDELRNVIK